MSDLVCCLNCWSWTKPGRRTTCKKCGHPLLYADGRPVGEIPAPRDPATTSAGPDADVAGTAGVAPRSRPKRWPLLAAVVALAIAAPAGVYAAFFRGAPSSPARDALLSAAHLASSGSLRISLSVEESFSVSGPYAPQFATLNGTSLKATMRMDVQSDQRSSAQVSLSIFDQDITVRAVQYDGTFYISTDGGATYQTLPVDAQWSDRYGPDSALQYLQAVGTVTDTGASTVDGVAVEGYHANLDGAKIVAAMKSQLSAVKSPLFDKVLNSIHYIGGALDANVDHNGHVLTERGAAEVALDLGALDDHLRDTLIRVHATFDSHFSDYGAAITVTRPGNVTGPAKGA